MAVLTIGTFDIPHAGHIAFLRKAKQFEKFRGELMIGVSDDAFVTEYKGRPHYTQAERINALKEAGFDSVVPSRGNGAELIKSVYPTIIVVGSDWLGRDYLRQVGLTQEDMRKMGFSVVFVPYSGIMSTTDIVRRVIHRDQ